ncbi:Uncharacterised protein [Bordetella pertussis]|nr:Uncharacterised protein [Bordetella pertussis]CFW44701.1 Uncharacterised protein [Bordetella pertussis]
MDVDQHRGGAHAVGREDVEQFVGVIAIGDVQRARQRVARLLAGLGIALENRLDVGYCRACVVLHIERSAIVMTVDSGHGVVYWEKP